ncbi:hypothetical protein HBB16_14975, partial [Pseudonocardia sp. MCCB 268]|nr:hypothetical protein [Pseudonocardia cytotoxica]
MIAWCTAANCGWVNRSRAARRTWPDDAVGICSAAFSASCCRCSCASSRFGAPGRPRAAGTGPLDRRPASPEVLSILFVVVCLTLAIRNRNEAHRV